ncbi:hypothetical protein P7C73_g6820, partial [Tremellales sp. Uapishka_1]
TTRTLSPISELTTPSSFSTLPLPTFPGADHTEDEIENEIPDRESLHPGESVETVRREPIDRVVDEDDKSTLTKAEAAPPPPGGLPPPPRTRLSAFPLPDPTTPRSEAKRRYDAKYGSGTVPDYSPFPSLQYESGPVLEHLESDEGGSAGLAGVGAGESFMPRPGELKKRPNSFYGRPSPRLEDEDRTPSPRPAYTSQHSHPTLHNIPIFHFPLPSEPETSSPKKESKVLVKSRPGSLNAPGSRPNSFHGSRPNSVTGGSTSDVHLPLSGLSKSASNVTVNQLPSASTIPLAAPLLNPDTLSPLTLTSPPPSSTSPSFTPPITTRQYPSTPARSPSTTARRPSGPQRTSSNNSIKRKAVPNFFTALFRSGSLDKPRSRTTSKGAESRPSSPTPDEHVPEPVTAIRTSGTFGIRDDGSQTSPVSQYSPDSTGGGGNGSTKTLGLKRILYVENGIHEEEGGEGETARSRVIERDYAASGDEYSGQVTEQERFRPLPPLPLSIDTQYSPQRLPSTPSPSEPRQSLDQAITGTRQLPWESEMVDEAIQATHNPPAGDVPAPPGSTTTFPSPPRPSFSSR